MIFAVKLGVKAAKSKTARKLAKKAARKIAENVEISVDSRGVDVDVAGRKFRVDSATFARRDATLAKTESPCVRFD